MELSFSIKDLPAPVLRKIRARAEANHRSLQEELLAIVVASAGETAGREASGLEDALRRWRGLFPKAAAGARTAAAISGPREPSAVPSDKATAVE